MTDFEQGLHKVKEQAVKQERGVKRKCPRPHPTGQKGSRAKESQGSQGTREAKATARDDALIDYASRGGGRGGLAGAAEMSLTGAMTGCHEMRPSSRAGRLSSSKQASSLPNLLQSGLGALGPRSSFCSATRDLEITSHKEQGCSPSNVLRVPSTTPSFCV